jgi:tetratricopeptide (TPR) repeat protein
MARADLLEQLQQAVNSYYCGKLEEAIDIGQLLLTRSRGTPHAATIHRHQAEFLHALGKYDAARLMAQEAGNLARATRHPDEILAASISVLACDFYNGQIAQVHHQLSELMELAPKQHQPLAFMGWIMMMVGCFDKAIQLCEQARGLLEEERDSPSQQLKLANIMLTEARSDLYRGLPYESISRLERILEMDLMSQVPGTLAKSLLGVAVIQSGEQALGMKLTNQAISDGRKINHDLHGQCLALAGQANLQRVELKLATEQLQTAVGLLTHPLERQESYFLLGTIARSFQEATESEQALRRAAEPTTESYFGRMAVQAMHKLVGLQAV